MKRQKNHAAFLISSHLLGLLLGGTIALAWNHDSAGSPARKPSDAATGGPGEIANPYPANTGRIRRSPNPANMQQPQPSSAIFKDAWGLMQRQSAADRARLRPVILTEWARSDLEAALEAALMEPDSATLLSAFDELFDHEPDAFRTLLAGERFGLKSAELRTWWIRKMGAASPDELLAMIGDFNSSDQGKVIKGVADGTVHEPAKMWAMIDVFAALPDTPANRKLWALAGKEVASRQNAETVVQQLSAIKGAAGDAMISEAMAVLLNRTDYAGARATYAALPADLKPQIVEAALKKPGENVSAYLAALDEVIHTPAWTQLQKPLAVKLHNSNPDAGQYPAMLEWAAQLPERDDTMDIYRVAVRKFVSHQPEKARQWIAEMTPGWKQQNSLAAYVQAALFARGDVEGANWAIPQINDPRFRAEADGFLRAYQERNRAKGN